MSENAQVSHPYYRIFGILTVLTVAEILWVFVVPHSRMMLAAGLGILAAAKAALVGLYYMHLKYEGKLLWVVALFPLTLVIVMIAGFLPDAIAPY
ncbi:MAG: cytochrome C oxidase subunit IV family protein [Planctomycetes bacterium]|nr:cytochrome C oxidase subunit IV family protein [Planctomycetota bacterium]